MQNDLNTCCVHLDMYLGSITADKLLGKPGRTWHCDGISGNCRTMYSESCRVKMKNPAIGTVTPVELQLVIFSSYQFWSFSQKYVISSLQETCRSYILKFAWNHYAIGGNPSYAWNLKMVRLFAFYHFSLVLRHESQSNRTSKKHIFWFKWWGLN